MFSWHPWREKPANNLKKNTMKTRLPQIRFTALFVALLFALAPAARATTTNFTGTQAANYLL